ncbi:MAG TPA: MFS transporter [Verrucomicrobiaceae bacterium]|jgi:MFS family permease
MKLTLTHWLIIIIASLGFLFDTYQLLMTPLVGPAAISELLKVPLSNQAVSDWMGNLLWLSALSGGFFGLLGGWLTDRLGRKFVMALGIFVYSFSPVAGAFSQTLPVFIFWRCATFVGVCIEFVAAITWIAEVFTDKAQKEKWLGITQLFASLGGVFVTAVSLWIGARVRELPHLGMPVALGAAEPASWRYLLLTGIIPALLIALMLPFVPESLVWRERKKAGTLKRPSFAALFSPELRRATFVTAGLSACAYGIAFGALQLTPGRVAPGLSNLAEERKQLKPLVDEAKVLNVAFDATQQATPERKAALEPIKINAAKQKPIKDRIKEVGDKTQLFQELGGLTGRIALALLLIVGMSRRLMLRMLQIPGVVILPLTYFMLYKQDATVFSWGLACAGFVVMSQLSFLGEYLPKVFPLHLRGTGGSFATNVGGRMIGTSAAFFTPWLASKFAGSPYDQMARAAGCVGIGIAIIAVIFGFFLPEPKGEQVD